MQRKHLALASATLTGILLALIFPPASLAFLAPAALTPLLYGLAHEPDWKRRLLSGWLAGLIFWLGVCHWIRPTLANFGGLNTSLSWLALLLFGAIKALHLGVFSILAGPVMKSPWAIPAVAALWTGIERTHGPLGFAWLALGNAGIDMAVPLRAAPWVGVYGLSFVFAALSAGLALVALRRPRGQLLPLVILPLLLLLPAVQLEKPPAEEAVSVQAAIQGDQSWSGNDKDKTVARLALLTLQSALNPSRRKPSLLLWPEVPAPFYYYQDEHLRTQTGELARLGGAPLLFGSVGRTAAGEPLNSAVAVDASGRLAGRYDKTRLVPFGEFIPPLFGWIEKISSEAGNYAVGSGAHPIVVAGHSLGVFICYEAAFPDYVRQFPAAGAEVLVNLTNDGYFGPTSARAQHLLLARMRAVENRRWLLRAANDGITASIDPAGRVWDRFPEFDRRSGRLRFSREQSRTLYSEWGDWFAWLCLLAGLAAAVATEVPAWKPAS